MIFFCAQKETTKWPEYTYVCVRLGVIKRFTYHSVANTYDKKNTKKEEKFMKNKILNLSFIRCFFL